MWPHGVGCAALGQGPAALKDSGALPSLLWALGHVSEGHRRPCPSVLGGLCDMPGVVSAASRESLGTRRSGPETRVCRRLELCPWLGCAGPPLGMVTAVITPSCGCHLHTPLGEVCLPHFLASCPRGVVVEDIRVVRAGLPDGSHHVGLWCSQEAARTKCAVSLDRVAMKSPKVVWFLIKGRWITNSSPLGRGTGAVHPGAPHG